MNRTLKNKKKNSAVRYLIIAAMVALFLPLTFFKYYEQEKTYMTTPALTESWRLAKPEIQKLNSGDLIFRHSRGTISNVMRNFSRMDSRYSHGGLISIEGEKVFVYHELGSEANANSMLRKERLEDFCAPDAVHSFGIYRLHLNSLQLHDLDSLIDVMYRTKLPFDNKYDMQTDSAMYCTEFMYKVITQAAGDPDFISRTRMPGFEYIACDNLYLNKHSTKIYSFVYPF